MCYLFFFSYLDVHHFVSPRPQLMDAYHRPNFQFGVPASTSALSYSHVQYSTPPLIAHDYPVEFHAARAPPTTTRPSFSETRGTAEPPRERKDFPETWIWEAFDSNR